MGGKREILGLKMGVLGLKMGGKREILGLKWGKKGRF